MEDGPDRTLAECGGATHIRSGGGIFNLPRVAEGGRGTALVEGYWRLRCRAPKARRLGPVPMARAGEVAGGDWQMTENMDYGFDAPSAPSLYRDGAETSYADFAPQDAALLEGIVAALRTVNDPEIPVNIYDLGLVYRIDLKPDGVVEIDMTLTAPGCPVAGTMMGWVQQAVDVVAGVSEVKMNLVFDPPWDKSRMSEEVQLELGLL